MRYESKNIKILNLVMCISKVSSLLYYNKYFTRFQYKLLVYIDLIQINQN